MQKALILCDEEIGFVSAGERPVWLCLVCSVGGCRIDNFA